MTVTSLYICISYIYTYSYNFYYLSSLHSYCMSIFSATCSMSLAQLLSILFLYFCFYTLHIPSSFYNLLFYVFDISSIYTFISQILSYNISYTVLYFYLHSYTFHIRYFCYFHLFLVFFIFQFYDLLHSMYYYIYHLLSCTYIISPFM